MRAGEVKPEGLRGGEKQVGGRGSGGGAALRRCDGKGDRERGQAGLFNQAQGVPIASGGRADTGLIPSPGDSVVRGPEFPQW